MSKITNHLPDRFQAALNGGVARLEKTLGENLHSLILYGSAVRGGFDPESSDLNLLIILKTSTAHAHQAVREALKGDVPIDPFIVELGEMKRAVRVFALKFMSIRRDCVILHGVDPFEDFEVSEDLLVMLTEQSLRNLRMRLVHSYITAGPQHRKFRHFLAHQSSRILIVLSDCLRCVNAEIPAALPDRIPVFKTLFDTDVEILRDLLKLRNTGKELSEDEAFDYHNRLIKLLKSALSWMESNWKELPL